MPRRSPSAEIATIREIIVRYARRMRQEGLVTGTSGNLSAKNPAAQTCLITPSGMEYDRMRPEDLVMVDLSGRVVDGGLRPSVDTMNHVAIYRARTDVAAVVHTHSPYATAFSVLHREIPPLLAEAAGFFGGPIRVMDYLPPASPQLGERAAAGLGRDRAILLPNHGVIAAGESVEKAFTAALLVEHSARVALLASLMGQPKPVPRDEVERIHRYIHQEYGQPEPPSWSR